MLGGILGRSSPGSLEYSFEFFWDPWKMLWGILGRVWVSVFGDLLKILWEIHGRSSLGSLDLGFFFGNPRRCSEGSLEDPLQNPLNNLWVSFFGGGSQEETLRDRLKILSWIPQIFFGILFGIPEGFFSNSF